MFSKEQTRILIDMVNKDLDITRLKILNDDKYADYVSKSAINSSKKYNWKDTSEKLNLLYQELKLR